jgi:hypothetical protein
VLAAPEIENQRVDNEGRELTHDDHDLVAGDEGAAAF